MGTRSNKVTDMDQQHTKMALNIKWSTLNDRQTSLLTIYAVTKGVISLSFWHLVHHMYSLYIRHQWVMVDAILYLSTHRISSGKTHLFLPTMAGWSPIQWLVTFRWWVHSWFNIAIFVTHGRGNPPDIYLTNIINGPVRSVTAFCQVNVTYGNHDKYSLLEGI